MGLPSCPLVSVRRYYYNVRCLCLVLYFPISGTIDDSLQINLSDPIQYAENTNYSAVHEVVGIGSSHYILAYYLAGEMNNRTADPSAEVNPGGPLLAQLVKFDSENNAIELVGTPVEYLSSSPAYYLSAANIDDESAVLVFADRSINYGLLAVLVAVDSVYGVLQFGSNLEFSTGQALGAGSSAVMDLDVTAVPPSDSASCGGVKSSCTKNSFAVLYSDATNDGLMTVVSGKVRTLVRSEISFAHWYILCRCPLHPSSSSHLRSMSSSTRSTLPGLKIVTLGAPWLLYPTLRLEFLLRRRTARAPRTRCKY